MTTLYRPFSPARQAEILALLQGSVANLQELSQLRGRLTTSVPALRALQALVDEEPGFAHLLFARVVPSILRYGRGLLERDACALPLHEPGVRARTVIPREDVAGWLAHMFFGTLPPPAPHHPYIDFARLLERERPQDLARLRSMLAYFDRIVDAPPEGRFEVERLVANARDEEDWAEDTSALKDFDIDPAGVIEDAQGHRQVDFANAYLGGAVLTHGCVQEEIRFAVCPEFLVAMIVSPRMRDDEAIVVRGAERFAKTRGYASSLRYDGPYHDPVARFEDGTPDVELVAIDALDYRRGDPRKQFTEAAMLRELNKARAGWRADARALPVATGNWGCGAFLGDIPLKAMLQWIAASAEGRALRYYSFGDERLGPLDTYLGPLRARFKTVGRLWEGLRVAVTRRNGSLYERLMAA